MKNYRKIEFLFTAAGVILAALATAVLIKGSAFVIKKIILAAGLSEKTMTQEIKFNLDELEKIKTLSEKK